MKHIFFRLNRYSPIPSTISINREKPRHLDYPTTTLVSGRTTDGPTEHGGTLSTTPASRGQKANTCSWPKCGESAEGSQTADATSGQRSLTTNAAAHLTQPPGGSLDVRLRASCGCEGRDQANRCEKKKTRVGQTKHDQLLSFKTRPTQQHPDDFVSRNPQ